MSSRRNICFIGWIAILVSWPGLESLAQKESLKKRDPFVALINSGGKMKTDQELFPADPQKVTVTFDAVLSAILWDEKKPLALINKKIYNQGAVLAEGVVLQKINKADVLLDNNGNPMTLKVRKNPLLK